jgi:hypothetical protein
MLIVAVCVPLGDCTCRVGAGACPAERGVASTFWALGFKEVDIDSRGAEDGPCSTAGPLGGCDRSAAV